MVSLNINLTGVSIGLVALCGPMHLRACVSEKRGDGEGAGSLAGRVIGLVVCEDRYTCVYV